MAQAVMSKSFTQAVPMATLKTSGLHVVKDYDAMSQWTANFIRRETASKPDLLLCASAGGTPTGSYQRLSDLHESNPKLFRKWRVLQIDEWGGLDSGNDATCKAYLENHLLRPLRIDRRRFAGFRTDASDPERECRRIAQWLIRNAPIDICLLGLGLNGHIAMIEPAKEIMPHAHVARLAASSLNHGMLKDLATKPGYGLTLGMADILRSRRVLLLVSGNKKRAALKRLLEGRVSSEFPASFLWLHPDMKVVCDRDAYG